MIQVYDPDKTLINTVITAQPEPTWVYGINAPKKKRKEDTMGFLSILECFAIGFGLGSLVAKLTNVGSK